MASLIRFGVKRFTGFLLFSKNELNTVRTITSKAVRDTQNLPKKPAPWPYKEKGFNQFTFFFDKTSARMDENSKIIVVEGPIAAGKSKFAKELAKELDMLYMPEANLDMIYINSYGFDLRKLDDQLPLSTRSFDVKDFLCTPKHENTGIFQVMQYYVKFSQYIDALAHVLSTGQGVVLDRCCYSDFVFAEAMHSQKYISKEVKKYYYEVRSSTISELLRPHLVIYLDVPVNIVLENIRKRNISCERASKALTSEYLCVMEKFYKQQYLKEINKHAELLVYDWSEGGEVEVVVEDIERISFQYDIQSTKSKDWDMSLEEEWAVARYKYANNKDDVMGYFNVPSFHIPEMSIPAEDVLIYDNVMQNAPGEMYAEGFNADMGDKNLLFRGKGKHRDTLPLRERIILP